MKRGDPNSLWLSPCHDQFVLENLPFLLFTLVCFPFLFFKLLNPVIFYDTVSFTILCLLYDSGNTQVFFFFFTTAVLIWFGICRIILLDEVLH